MTAREGRKPLTTLLGKPIAYSLPPIVHRALFAIPIVAPPIAVLSGVWPPDNFLFQIVMYIVMAFYMIAGIFAPTGRPDVLNRLQEADAPLCLRCGRETHADGDYQVCDRCENRVIRNFVLDAWYRAFGFVSPLRIARVATSELRERSEFSVRAGAFLGVSALCLTPVLLIFGEQALLVVLIPAGFALALLVSGFSARDTLTKIAERKCLRCGYSLQGLPEFQCPECGFGLELREGEGDPDPQPAWARSLRGIRYAYLAGIVAGIGVIIAGYLVVEATLTIDRTLSMLAETHREMQPTDAGAFAKLAAGWLADAYLMLTWSSWALVILSILTIASLAAFVLKGERLRRIREGAALSAAAVGAERPRASWAAT